MLPPLGGGRLFAFFHIASGEQKFPKYTFDDIKCVYCYLIVEEIKESHYCAELLSLL